MEADLQHHYRIDLRDLWRPTTVLTFRRLRVLLDGLPPESLWCTQIRRTRPADVTPAGDIDGMRWGTVHDLLAALIDATNDVQHTLAQVNSTTRITPPKPFPRPGTGRRRTGMSRRSRDRIAGWLRTSRTGRGGEQHGV